MASFPVWVLFIAVELVQFATITQAQLVEQYHPPKANCCPRWDAQLLADELRDFNQLGQYHADDERLKTVDEQNRVVFLGDS